MLKGAATPLDLGDPSRSGAGLPDAVRALGLAPTAAAAGTPAAGGAPAGDPGDAAAAQGDAIRTALAQVQGELNAAGLLDGLAPAAAAPPAGPIGPSAADISRSLLSVEAQLAAAGLAVR